MMMFVHVLGWGINVSPASMIGNPCTKTVALSGVIGKMGIRDRGGHQQEYSLILIVLGIGGLPQDWVLCTTGGKQSPCPEQGRPFRAATGFRSPNGIKLHLRLSCHRYMGIHLDTHRSRGCPNYEVCDRVLLCHH